MGGSPVPVAAGEIALLVAELSRNDEGCYYKANEGKVVYSSTAKNP